ncbi:hypothetical protein EZV62_004033 [Acer yangbiense]|uniref:Reverse transcriptase Ty1/copia-type domain-containing protein n=1 Tax=Acer yangbiense TaxID=1000413 RepID=A0A5C7IIY4_9ROSI|nr:hypothetical protein EZV62_004033 [Acer yangbiense]
MPLPISDHGDSTSNIMNPELHNNLESNSNIENPIHDQLESSSIPQDRPVRSRRQPEYLKDYICSTVTSTACPHPIVSHGTGDNIDEIQSLKKLLNSNFRIKDLGCPKYFLGCRSARTPMEQNLKLNAEDGEPLQDLAVYRRLIGRLIYLSITRLDILFAVNILSQFMQTPRKTHLDAALRVLRYLKGSPGLLCCASCTVLAPALNDPFPLRKNSSSVQKEEFTIQPIERHDYTIVKYKDISKSSGVSSDKMILQFLYCNGVPPFSLVGSFALLCIVRSPVLSMWETKSLPLKSLESNAFADLLSKKGVDGVEVVVEVAGLVVPPFGWLLCVWLWLWPSI